MRSRRKWAWIIDSGCLFGLWCMLYASSMHVLAAEATPSQNAPLGNAPLQQQTITIPDICFGSDCATARLKITDITATEDVSTGGFDAQGTLTVNIPGNVVTHLPALR